MFQKKFFKNVKKRKNLTKIKKRLKTSNEKH